MGPEVKQNDPAFLHPTALAYGNITLHKGASMWPYSVIRAESASVTIGEYVNLQDFTMVHASPGFPVVIGDYTSVTHHSTIHGCRIGKRCLVGINATIYDGANIGDNCIIGQHAYVKDGTDIPDNSIVVGSPSKIIRTSNNAIQNTLNAMLYHRNALAYAVGDYRAWDGPDFEKWVMQTMEKLQKELGGDINITNA